AKIEFADRLKLIGAEVKKIIQEYKPEILAIETLFLNTNQKTVMHVAEARGVVIYEATLAGLSIFEASPPQIKMATTGYGRASAELVLCGELENKKPRESAGLLRGWHCGSRLFHGGVDELEIG
ncbi:MAG: crossover junction endodeoxyribonuclease RuvC, partial [Patescibacteria group bacterium]